MLLPIVFALALWYLYYGAEAALNGGTLGRNRFLMPFQCFWEEFLWNIPGGTRRKRVYLMSRCSSAAYARPDDVLRGPLEFWLTMLGVLAFGALMGVGAQILLWRWLS